VSNGQGVTPRDHTSWQQQKQNRNRKQQQPPHRIAQPPPAHQANQFAPLAQSTADSTVPSDVLPASPTQTAPLAEPTVIPDGPPISPTPIRRVRFNPTKPHIHTYNRNQPLNTRSGRTTPQPSCMRAQSQVVDVATATVPTPSTTFKRGCMKVPSPVVVKATTTLSDRFRFRSLLPQGVPVSRPYVPTDFHIFTISNASIGPHGGVLFRIEAMVLGHRVRCLLDCGASSDFISIEFIKRHGLEKFLQATKHSVRGYDGQLTPAAGVLTAPVILSAFGMEKEAQPQQLLAAQLHSDDIILGLPWLAATGAVIDFAARSVTLDHDGARRTISLAVALSHDQPLQAAPTATSRLMDAVLTLYSAELNNTGRVSHSELARAMRSADDDETLHPHDGIRGCISGQVTTGPASRPWPRVAHQVAARLTTTAPPAATTEPEARGVRGKMAQANGGEWTYQRQSI
jgi:hypothetical protein